MHLLNSKLNSILLLGILLVSQQNFLCAQEPDISSYLKKGNDHSALYHYEEALVFYKQATDMAPSNWEGWFQAGKCLLKLKQIDEAEKYLTKAYSLNNKELDLQKALGSIYIQYAKTAANNGNYAAKNENMLKACHAYPAGTKIWLSLLEQWWESGEFNKIKAEGDFIVKNNSLLLEQGDDVSLQKSLVLVAKAYYGDGDYTKTDYFLKYAGMIRNTNDEIYTLKREIKHKTEEAIKKQLELAKAEIDKNNFEKALEILNNAAKLPGGHTSEADEQREAVEKLISIKKYNIEIDKLLSSNDYEKALAVLEEALQSHPDNEDFASKYAKASEELEKIEHEKAVEAERKSLAEERKRIKANQFAELVKKAKQCESEGNFDEAIKACNDALKIYSDKKEIKEYIETLTQKSKAERQRQAKYNSRLSDLQDKIKNGEDFEGCCEEGESLLTDYPEHKETICPILGEAYVNLENYDKAVKHAEVFAENAQYKNLYNYILGMNHYEKGENASASEYLNKVTGENTTYKKSATKLLWLMFFKKIQIGIYMMILALVLWAVPKIKDNLKASKENQKVRKLEKIRESGDYAQNLEWLQERYENQDISNMKLVVLLLAAANLKSGNPQRAYELVTEYLKKDNRNPLAKNIAGEAAMAIGDTSNIGLEHIQGLLKLNESRTDVINYLAQAYMQTKQDHKLAQEYISKAISLNPNDNVAVSYLADIYISRQNYSAQTVKTFERAIKINPDKPDYYIALMQNYKVIGNEEAAAKQQSIIEEKFPDYNGQSLNQGNALYGQQQQGYYDNPQSFYGQQQDYGQYSYQPEENNAPVDSVLPSLIPETPQVENDVINTAPVEEPTMPNLDIPTPVQEQSYSVPTNTPSAPYQSAPQQVSASNTQNPYYPNYDNIGDGLPDLNSIGVVDGQDANTDFGLPTFLNKETLGKQTQSQPQIIPAATPIQPKQAPIISGPKKTCPHCQAINAANEYYCTTCGKPF